MSAYKSMKGKLNKYRKHQQYKARKALRKRRKKYRKGLSAKYVHHARKSIIASSTFLAQILEYEVLFGSKNKPTINELISQIPREKAILLAGVLNNFYGTAGLDKLDDFFSSSSINNRLLINTLLERYLSKKKNNSSLFWMTSETPIQLLRYSFAYPFSEIRTEAKSNEEVEMLVFRLILLMNEQCTRYKIRQKEKNIENMLFLLSVLNGNMHGQDENVRKDRCIMQLYMAVEFFHFFLNEERYQPIYNAFLAKHNVVSWREYLRSIFAILAVLRFNSGWIPKDLSNDVSRFINPNILNSLSINFSDDIKFFSDGPAEREGNTDYKTFRECPLVRMPNGDFYLFNWEFMVDRLFNSLYFEMKELPIDKKLKNAIPGIFTDKFAERIVFDKLVENSASSAYKLYSEDTLRKVYKNKPGELGPPDYLLESENSYILFECKDIRIGGDEIETHDFETVVDIYSNKLYKKKWKYENGAKCYFTSMDKAERRIGITQLTTHLSNIRKGTFKYHHTDSRNKIYPVLILSDFKYVHRGLTKIANKWYNESLTELNESTDGVLNRPLILMSFITLIKYKKLFIEKGFDFYFEQYYKLFFTSPLTQSLAVESNKSFDEFMAENAYDLSELHKDLFDEITVDFKM